MVRRFENKNQVWDGASEYDAIRAPNEAPASIQFHVNEPQANAEKSIINTKNNLEDI